MVFKINFEIVELEMARQGLIAQEVIRRAGMPKPTWDRAKRNKAVRPLTAGKIARALGVDVLDIIIHDDELREVMEK